MPNWVKRVAKDRAEDLGPGEVVVAATYFQGRGSAAGQIAFGAVSSAVNGVLGQQQHAALGVHEGMQARDQVLSHAKGRYNTFEGSIAAQIPARAGVLAATPGRLIVFPFTQSVLRTKVEPPVASLTYQQVAGWSYRPGTLTSTVNLAFVDGSDVGIEIPRVNAPDRFARSLNIPQLG